MTIAVQTIPVGTKLIDTTVPLDARSCGILRNAGVEGVIRYFENLSPSELMFATACDLGVCIVGFARAPRTWVPSGQLGSFDAAHAITKTKALAEACEFDPKGLIQWCDLEGALGPAQGVIDYLTAFGDGCQHVMQIGGCYEGADQPLGGAELAAIPTIHAYWCSFSDVPKVTIGYQMIQLFDTQPAPGGLPFEVDYDFVQKDRRGRLPTWLKATG